MAWSFDDDAPDEPTALEAAQSLRLTDGLLERIAEALEAPETFRITPALICALNGLVDTGTFRDGPITIRGSAHMPPPAEDVPRLVDEFCAQLADLVAREPTHLAAYALWRLNWIHPFEDGNGRTARAVSYLALAHALQYRPPGLVALPERILREKRKYFTCLEQADRAWKKKRLDVSHMKGFLERLLRAQLKDGIAEESNDGS